MLVRQILAMTGGPDVVTIEPEASVADAAQLLSRKRIGALVVCSADRPVGMLSERDIVRELGRRGEVCLGEGVGHDDPKGHQLHGGPKRQSCSSGDD